MNHAAISNYSTHKGSTEMGMLTPAEYKERYSLKIMPYRVTLDMNVKDVIQLVLDAIYNVMGFTEYHMIQRCKKRELSVARHIFIYVCYNHMRIYNYSFLGRYIRRDHTVAKHSATTLQNLLDTNDTYATTMYNKVIEKLG